VQQKEFVEKLDFYLLIVNDGSDEQMLNFFCTNLNLISFQLNAFELNFVRLNFNLMKFEFHFNVFQLNLDRNQLNFNLNSSCIQCHSICFSSLHFMII